MAQNNYYEIERNRRLSILEKDIKNNDLIFIDTCAVMDPFFPDFLSNVIPILIRENKQMVVLRTVLMELRRKLEQMRSSSLAEDIKIEARAYMGLYSLNKLINYKLLCYDEKEDDIADHSFEDMFITLRRENRLLLITQDKNLTANILSFNKNEAVRGKIISVKMINNWGFLETRTPSGRQEYFKSNNSDNSAKKIPVHKPTPKVHNPSPVPQKAVVAPNEEIATLHTLSELHENKRTVVKAKPRVKPAPQPASEPAPKVEEKPKADEKPIKAEDKPETTIEKPIAKPVTKAISKKDSFEFGQVFTASEAGKQSGDQLTISNSYVAIAPICRQDVASVNIANGVTRILANAFEGCSRLESVTIPKSVVAIDKAAFPKNSKATIICEKDSHAHTFAINKGMQFRLI
ncbi:MAG: leucine-rich repeat protein [Clostridiales bacterium]|nr:leucine-rich repeat protein [Clostridiales bacterium]